MALKPEKANRKNHLPTINGTLKSEEQYRRLFETAQDGILLLDAESGAITDANPFITHMLGYTLEDIIGKRLWEIGAFMDVKESKSAFEELQEKEYIRYEDLPLKTKSGRTREVEFVSNVYLVNGTKVIQCNIRDITERKHAEEALSRSEERYRRLFETAQDGILLLDAESGAITDANPFIIHLLGYTLEDIIGKRLWEIGAFADVKDSKAAFEELQRKEYIRYEDLPLKTKEGKRREVEFVSNVYLVNGKRIIQCNIRDITERKRAEERVQKSEEEFRIITEHSADAIFITDAQGHYTYVNSKVEHMLGYSNEELLSYTIADVSPKTRAEEYFLIFQHVLHEGSFFGEIELVKKDGTIIPVDLNSVVLPNGLIYGSCRDVTARKQTERLIRESEKRFKALFDQAPIAIALVDLDGHTIISNKTLSTMVGYSNDELLRMKFIDFTYPPDADKDLEKFSDLIHGKISHYSMEKRFVHKNGSLVWVNLFVTILRDENDNHQEIIGMAEDISVRKQAAIALQESNEKFLQLAGNISDAFWIRSPDMSEVQYVSPAFEKIWGRPVETLYANPEEWSTFVHPEDRNRVNSSFAGLSSGKSNLDIEYRIVRPDGDIRWVHLRGFQVRDNTGQLIRHIGIVSDITDRRHTEDLLRESEEKFRTVIETLPDGFYRSTVEGRFVDVNMAMVKMLGYDSKDELLQVDIPSELYFQQDDRIPGQYNEDFTGDIEIYQLKKKDGTGVWVEDRCHYLKDESGNIKYHEGISRDITERRAAEEKQKKSEEKYRGIFENVQDVYYETSLDGTVFEVSPSISIVSKGQYAREDLIGVSMFDFYSEKTERNMLLADLKKNGVVSDYEVLLKNRDGTKIPCSISAKIQFNAAGRPDKIIGSMRDITERKMAQEALMKGEERYRRLVEYSPSAIMVHRNGKFVYINPAAVELLGAHDSTQLLGKSIHNILHKDHKESSRLKYSISEEYKQGLIQSKEKFLRLDGVTIDVEIVSLMIEYDGKPAMQDVVRNVTEQIKLQQQLLQSQKSESIGTLAGGIAHDFNNILGIILGYTYIIEHKKSDERALSDSVIAINQAVKRGASLVRQILTFARKTETIFAPIDSADLVNEIVSMLKQTFPRIIEIKNQVPTDLPFIHADRTQMHQTILNLCVNARDAMPSGGTISITATEISGAAVKEKFFSADQQSYLCISVSDTGEGMSEATKIRIFDPFFTTKPQGKGTGLGLSVVAGIVQAHHGFINVESEPGKGTAFNLYFPVSRDTAHSTDSHPNVHFAVGGHETILMVEDEELLLNAVTLLLESNGYTVLSAHDGAEAVETYKRHQSEISLVLTDLGLPIMTGLEEYKQLKEITPDIKIIFASGFIDPDIKSELMIAGAQFFLQKPYVADEVLKIIREALDKNKVL